MSKVIVIGGGAAGMIAAIAAAANGHKVILLEKNEKLGKKLYITGKGRCNITNACDTEELFKSIVTNPKFLYSAFYTFTNHDMIEFLNKLGLKTKIERGCRVFPDSDKSSDVISTLKRELLRLNVVIKYNCSAEDIIINNNKLTGVKIKSEKDFISGDAVIIATGGLSYPTTGSTGDGFHMAETLGHSLKRLTPSLVPFEIDSPAVKELQGLSLKNIRFSVTSENKTIYSEPGELLFTHFGISGPVVLSASSYVSGYLEQKKSLNSHIDLKPALSAEQLNQRVLRDFEEYNKKQFKNSLDGLLPKKLIPVIIEQSKIDSEKKVSLITRQERERLVSILKDFQLPIKGLRGYAEAVVTKGGVSVKEINPSTMESKVQPGVYFAGEVLDVDALTGGYNLQIAWSTGYLAGSSIL